MTTIENLRALARELAGEAWDYVITATYPRRHHPRVGGEHGRISSIGRSSTGSSGAGARQPRH